MYPEGDMARRKLVRDRASDDDAKVLAAEAALQQRLAEVEAAHAEGRLWDLVKDTPPVADQIRAV